jgi:hypothetical protein
MVLVQERKPGFFESLHTENGNRLRESKQKGREGKNPNMRQ